MVYLFLVAQVLETNNVCWFSFCLDRFDKLETVLVSFLRAQGPTNQQLLLVFFLNEQVMETNLLVPFLVSMNV